MIARRSLVPHVLDNPVFAALSGPHAHFALSRGEVLRYPPAMSPFLGMPAGAGPQVWADALALVGDEGMCAVVSDGESPRPDGWEERASIDLVQLVAADSLGAASITDAGAADPRIVPLGDDDVPAMLALTAAAKPGPFEKRTIDFGHYLGIHDGGTLVAMAGHRMRAPGWTEISAVSTAATHRGQGLASLLIRTLAAGIVADGERPFMHATASNTGAIRLYESLGFTVRRPMRVTALAPAGATAGERPPR